MEEEKLKRRESVGEGKRKKRKRKKYGGAGHYTFDFYK